MDFGNLFVLFAIAASLFASVQKRKQQREQREKARRPVVVVPPDERPATDPVGEATRSRGFLEVLGFPDLAEELSRQMGTDVETGVERAGSKEPEEPRPLVGTPVPAGGFPRHDEPPLPPRNLPVPDPWGIGATARSGRSEKVAAPVSQRGRERSDRSYRGPDRPPRRSQSLEDLPPVPTIERPAARRRSVGAPGAAPLAALDRYDPLIRALVASEVFSPPPGLTGMTVAERHQIPAPR